MNPSDWLRADWQQLLNAAGLPPADQVRDELLCRYAEPARFYHNQQHLHDVLTVIHQLEKRIQDLPAVLLAAWFHDAVYDPHATDNEEQSAALAQRLLGEMGVSAITVSRVTDLILRTKTHHAYGNADASVLLDADLAILGAPPAEYKRYAAAIRQEYAWVPDAAYRNGRRKILEGFLQRERIYHTAEMHQLHEAPARQNLRSEIEQLG